MLEDKKAYIDQLINELEALKQRVVSVKNEEALPFSFFREAFAKMQSVSLKLHELELLQIDDMKRQMEKLVLFLSESATNKTPETTSASEEETVAAETEIPQEPTPDEPAQPHHNEYGGGIVLPEYKNPRMSETQETPSSEEEIPVQQSETPVGEPPVVRSFNDTVQAPPAVLDLKRSISLNDRFLFQRELFRNDRHEMNNMMLKLNAFANYADAEDYLRHHTAWNFEDDTVKDFLLVIKKGFE